MNRKDDFAVKRKRLVFPKGFLWGAATSAHQVEGGTHNDWSNWEKENAERLAKEAHERWGYWQRAHFPEMLKADNYISGKACDHYNRYTEDFDIARKMHNNAHRFSIEWSRIEPEKGVFDRKELEHYRKVLKSLRARNMKPFVTLWHWTIPLWLAEEGGLESKKFPEYFARFSRFVVENLGDLCDFWVTLNEPTSVVASAYVTGKWPPQKRDIFSAVKVMKNLARAHNFAYKEIHEVSATAQVGFSNIFWYVEPFHRFSPFDRIFSGVVRHFTNKEFLNLTYGNNDFLAVQYYFHKLAKFPRGLSEGGGITSDLGWELCPKGVYHVLKSLKKYNLPIYITESGLADADDSRRTAFIRNNLYWIHKAIAEGVDVRGYFHWSLLDNFEWSFGFWPRFGLVEVNYKTMERRMRRSAWEYAEICKANGFEIDVKE